MVEQLRKLLTSLSIRQRISIAVAALLVGVALFSLTRWRKESDFKPLYTGMSAEDAAAVVQRLKEGGVEYRISETGGNISVPSARVPELRLEMAAAGLPRTGRIGFEIFDKTNFGATEFVEHVNYRRALEGELERSVQCLAEVEQARVHLTFPKDSVFLEARQAAKASVMVKLRPGARLSQQNVMAITSLIGNAVEGLAPEGVSVLDMRGNLLTRPRGSDEVQESETMLEFRQKIERDILTKINGTLEPLLGADRFRAGVSVDCDLTSGEQSEENFDPARSVMASSQKTEDVTTGMLSGGQPGTVSNLPRPAARAASTGAGTTRRTENITYQSSHLVKKVKLPQGGVKRMSISLLVDQAVRWEGVGSKAKRVLVPPSPETLKSVRDLVAGVSGFMAERGDQIVVETLPFESTLNQEPPGSQTPAPSGAPINIQNLMRDPKLLLIAAGAAVGLLVLLLVGVALWLRSRKKTKNKKTAPGAVQTAAAIESGPDTNDLAAQLERQLAEQAAEQARMDAAVLKSIKMPTVTSKKTEILVKQVRDSVKGDAASSVHVVQGWIHERES